MSSPAQCVGMGPLPEPPEAYSTPLLAPVHIVVDVFAALLVGKAQGLSFLLAQEPRNDTTTFVKTLNFIRGMLGTYPALTVVAIVIALLNLVPGGLMFLWNATSDVEEVLDEEPDGTERCQLAVLKGSMAVILVVLGALLVTSFAANSLYSDNIFRLPEHAQRFRSILTAYKDDVHNTSGCVLQSQSHHIAASLAPAYSSCTQALIQDVPKHDLQHRADIGKIREYLSALSTAAILADNLELSLLRLRQWQERADPLLFAAVPVKPTAADCDGTKHDFCKKLNSSWISLRDAAKAFSLEPPHVSGVIKKLRSLIEEDRIGTLEAEISQYEVMTSDTAKYLKTDVKKDWQPELEAVVYGQSHVQGLRITMVLSRFTEVISWVSNWADPVKTPTLHLASNLSHLNTLHMSALTCAWLLSVLALGLSFIGERQTGRLLVRLSEALFACFVLQVHVVVSVLLFLGLVGQRAVCEPALEPWSDETKASINQLVAIDARQRWMADMPEVVRRCHLKKSVYQAFKTNTAPGSAEKTGVSAPPELAHALFALEATPALNTSVVFQGLLSNLLSADSMALLNTILSLQLTSLSTSDMKQVKVHVLKLAEWMDNVSSIAKSAILTITGTLQENDELLKNELDRRSALLDEAVAVVRGSIPDIDAYTAAEVQINNSKVLAKQAAAAAQLATLYEARQVLAIADSTSCLQMAALRITQDVVVNIREGVRTQIGKCAYLSQAYNLSVHVVCDKIVYSMVSTAAR